mgnify:CR=1 FL=1
MFSKKADTMVVKEVIELVIVAALILLSVFVGYKLWGLFFGQKEDANTLNNFDRLTTDIDELLNSPESFVYKTPTYYIKKDYSVFYRVGKDKNEVALYLNKKDKGNILEKKYDKILFSFDKGLQDIPDAEDTLKIGFNENEIVAFYVDKTIEKVSQRPIISFFIYTDAVVQTRKAIFEKTKCTENEKIIPPCYCGINFVTEQDKYCCKKNEIFTINNECCNPSNIKCDGQITSCCECDGQNYDSGYCYTQVSKPIYINCNEINSCKDYCDILKNKLITLLGTEEAYLFYPYLNKLNSGNQCKDLCISNFCKKGTSVGCIWAKSPLEASQEYFCLQG